MIERDVNTQKNIMLMVTEQCNLRCTYCYETHISGHELSVESMKRILDNHLTIDDGTDSAQIEFFGGEAFLGFEKIREVCEYVWSKDWPKKYIFFSSTNGTLVHGEIQQWLLKNKDRYVCGLSLDGIPEIHNLNRSNSYNLIDIDFFAKTWPDQQVKMTISENSLNFLSDNVIHAHEKGFEVACNLAYGDCWKENESKYLAIYERELSKLIDYYMEHPDIKPCSMLEDKLINIGNSKLTDTCGRWCGAGINMHVFDWRGYDYPCQMFLPISQDGAELINTPLEFMEKIPNEKINIECRECILKEACATCYGFNYKKNHNIYYKNIDMCNYNKLMFAAQSVLGYKRYKAGLCDFKNETEEYFYLQGIRKLQELFRSIKDI